MPRFTRFLIPQLLIPFFVSTSALNAQVQVHKYDIENHRYRLIEIVKNNSAFAHVLNWEEIDSVLSQRADTMTSLSSATKLTDYLISKLKAAGDNHSFLLTKTVTKKYDQGTFVVSKPEAKFIAGDIVHIIIPALSTSNSTIQKEFATEIQNLIRKFDSKNYVKGWIVDLRNNTGGGMYPMIAGVGPLLGSGKLGYFVKSGKKKMLYTPWHYKAGAAGLGKGISVNVDQPYKLKNRKTKVAVLIS